MRLPQGKMNLPSTCYFLRTAVVCFTPLATFFLSKQTLVGQQPDSLIALDRWASTTTYLLPPPDFQCLDLEVELQGWEVFSGSGRHRSLSLGGSVRPGAPSDGQYGGENARFGVEVERAVRRERAVFEYVREEAFGNETFGGDGLDTMTLVVPNFFALILIDQIIFSTVKVIVKEHHFGGKVSFPHRKGKERTVTRAIIALPLEDGKLLDFLAAPLGGIHRRKAQAKSECYNSSSGNNGSHHPGVEG